MSQPIRRPPGYLILEKANKINLFNELNSALSKILQGLWVSPCNRLKVQYRAVLRNIESCKVYFAESRCIKIKNFYAIIQYLTTH